MFEIKSYFTQNKDAEKLFKWKKVKVKIYNSKQETLLNLKKIEAPQNWSQQAVDIAASKYLRRDCESSIRHMVHRVVNAISKQAKVQGYFKSKKALKEYNIFEQELKFILLSQRAFFNSPVWFNCGLYESYNIRSTSNSWYWDPKNKRARQESLAYRHPQVSACFIQSVDDSLDSIFELAKTEARLFKFGSGSGTNFSNLRSRFEKLEGGGTSSGLISFLEVLDKGAGSIKSGGKTRRAAKMVIINDDHPELLDFINWKKNEEKKARILIQNGFSSDFEGEAYQTVSGQNSNNSILISKKFLDALEKNRDWNLKLRTSSKVYKKIKAKEIWDQIVDSAYDCGDPGLQFDQTIQKWNTCKESGRINSTNPCSEFVFLDDTACNLASLNLLKFLNEDNQFDLDGFIQTIKIIFLSQEILIDYASYPTQFICENSHNYRPLGIGLTGFGSFLIRLGIPYDSKEASEMASALASLLTGQAYLVSTQVARFKKPFSFFKKNKDSMLKILKMHKNEINKIKSNNLNRNILEQSKKVWTAVLINSKKYGIRNSQASAIAPAGTISLVLDSETTGIEPEFSLVKMKKFAGGETKKIVNESFIYSLKKLKYSQSEINQIKKYILNGSKISNINEIKKEHKDIFKSALEISPESHLKILAAMQPFMSGAISKTVNLPNNVSKSKISEIYLMAFRLGLKSISIYRDGCKASQPLTTIQNPKCLACGIETVFTGSCYRCDNCGEVIGCS